MGSGKGLDDLSIGFVCTSKREALKCVSIKSNISTEITIIIVCLGGNGATISTPRLFQHADSVTNEHWDGR